ncbi:hypothetical protein ACHAXR_009525 [Thalassiosira sp. AJA248-18]
MGVFIKLCILHNSSNQGSLFSSTVVIAVDAFSSPSIIINHRQRHHHQQQQRQRRVTGRRSDSTTTSKTNTQLHEQPTNLKKLLGPISPSTLEKYNLPPAVLPTAWSAQIVTRTAKSMDESTELQLIPKNPKEHYVDTVQMEVSIPLDCPPGLGIELLEVEGGRDDGLGIVIVNGLVPGNSGGGGAIMYGDTIVEAELILRRRNGQLTDVKSIRTECLGYDATVDALGGMLSSLLSEEEIMLTLKRLRRRPNIQVTLHYPPSQDLPSETLQLQAGDNLRMVMLQRGVKLNDPLAVRYDGKAANSGNCGGGAMCRTCAVSVLRGGELLSRPKQNEKKMLEETPRWRLACKSWMGYGMMEGEVVIQVNPRQW